MTLEIIIVKNIFFFLLSCFLFVERMKCLTPILIIRASPVWKENEKKKYSLLTVLFKALRSPPPIKTRIIWYCLSSKYFWLQIRLRHQQSYWLYFDEEKQNDTLLVRQKKSLLSFKKVTNGTHLRPKWVLAVEAFQLMLQVQVIKKCYMGHRRIIFFMKFFLRKYTFTFIK